jgi:hypothetical protein
MTGAGPAKKSTAAATAQRGALRARVVNEAASTWEQGAQCELLPLERRSRHPDRPLTDLPLCEAETEFCPKMRKRE